VEVILLECDEAPIIPSLSNNILAITNAKRERTTKAHPNSTRPYSYPTLP
jgi:hypothetical protein